MIYNSDNRSDDDTGVSSFSLHNQTCADRPSIRSFGPEKGETIHFTGPLTLIVGWNGSGKTVRTPTNALIFT